MTIHKITNYYADQLFSVLGVQVKAAIEDAFATVLLQINQSIRSEVIAVVSNAVEETIRDKQADLVIL